MKGGHEDDDDDGSQVYRSLFRRGFNSTIFDTGKMYTYTYTSAFMYPYGIVSKPIFITFFDRYSLRDTIVRI